MRSTLAADVRLKGKMEELPAVEAISANLSRDL
jgi:hypothetical protein